MARVGVFDSGIGGLSVAKAIILAIPDAEVSFANDEKNVPYGSKTPDKLYKLVLPIFRELAQESDVIVVACNTVSATLIDKLRANIKIPLIAMEPMIKPASEMTNSKIVAVCATPTTLASSRYAWLKDKYAKEVKVLEPDCSEWAYMIEGNNVQHDKINKQIREVCEKGADTIVLGCTHYHWIEQDIKRMANQYNATVLQPEQPVINQLKRVLEQLS